MRPLRLEFQAFGSYPGKQVVDFAALARRGLFVVTGPTGTGKTTVFDAMVYALYGVLPGQRSADGDPRSHHAAPTVDTYVQLTFEVDGEQYVVRRTPRQEVPKARGEGMKVQAADAFVVRLVGDGTESIATQMTKTSGACERLVGLDAKQFQRVVLLPQGKFTDFLIATDEDREKLLRQLFGGELFEQATLWLKRRVSELDDQVRGVDVEVQHHRSNANDALRSVQSAWSPDVESPDPSSLDDASLRGAIDAFAPVRSLRDADRERLQQLASDATTALANARVLAQRHDDAQAVERRLVELSSEAAEVVDGEQRASASRRARPVVQADDAAVSASQRAADAATALAALRDEVEHAFAALGRPVPPFDAASIAAQAQAVGRELDDQVVQLRAARKAGFDAREADDAVATVRHEHQRLAEHAAALKAELDELGEVVAALEPVATEVPLRERAHGDATARREHRRRLDDTRHQLDEARRADDAARTDYEAVMARFVATQAPRLAAELHDDEPCPVCGSITHPAPAQSADGDAVDHGAVDAARAVWTTQSNRVAGLDAAVESLRSTLAADADAPLTTFDVEVDAATDALERANVAAAELAAARQRFDQRSAAFTSATTAALAEQQVLDTRTGAAAALRAEAERLAVIVADIDEAELESHLQVHRALDAALVGVAAAFDAVTASVASSSDANDRRDEALAVSGFADVPSARAALLDLATETASSERAERWRADSATQQARRQQLAEQGVPDERPDVDAAASIATDAAQAAQAATEAFTTAANALRTASSELDRALTVAADSAALRQQRDDARVVFRTCNGDAGMGVKLERWVLAGELDRVTDAANHHLARMTNHRYTLRRNGTKGGLTLEVFDAHTGRSRATASLSGGEQFQASLSLALGLADVVSHGGAASGRQFEALFVDEGFGSLDPNALDDAIAALAQLHAAGRTVGAITHVEAMKQQLHVGIEVSALPDGRGSTLTVHP